MKKRIIIATISSSQLTMVKEILIMNNKCLRSELGERIHIDESNKKPETTIHKANWDEWWND